MKLVTSLYIFTAYATIIHGSILNHRLRRRLKRNFIQSTRSTVSIPPTQTAITVRSGLAQELKRRRKQPNDPKVNNLKIPSLPIIHFGSHGVVVDDTIQPSNIDQNIPSIDNLNLKSPSQENIDISKQKNNKKSKVKKKNVSIDTNQSNEPTYLTVTPSPVVKSTPLPDQISMGSSRQQISENSDTLELSGQAFYLQHTTNQKCLNSFCQLECKNADIYYHHPSCLNCLEYNGCTKRGHEILSYKSCGQTECSNDCVLDKSVLNKNINAESRSRRATTKTISEFKKLQAEQWGSKNCSICMASACVNQPATKIKNLNEQCNRKCKMLNSCDNHNLTNEKNFKACSSECHINYDNIKEARQCVNNLCNQHLKPACRSCLDVCVLETLVLGSYSIPEVKLLEHANQLKRQRQDFIYHVLPRYQLEVEYQEKANYNHDPIDYTGLNQFEDESDYLPDYRKSDEDSLTSSPQSPSIQTLSRASNSQLIDEINHNEKLKFTGDPINEQEQQKSSRLKLYSKARLQMARSLGRR